MDPISYSKAAQQEQRIKKFVAQPDSVAGLVSVPNVVPTGETITIPAGRTVVHPNLQVAGTLDVQGTLFIPSGGSVSTTEVDATVVKQNGNVVANDSAVVHKTGDETIAGIKTFTAPQRSNITTDNDLSFDLAVTNKFKCTPTALGTLTFTNLAAQSGTVILDNTGGFAISLAASIKAKSGVATTLSTAGVYLIGYDCDGTNVYITVSAAMV